jgi:type IV pilus assembly protein PilM
MAAQAKILGLNLGMQTVALAEFRTGANGGLVLVAFESVELLENPASDSTRLNQTKIAVEEIRSRMGIRGGKINYAISAQSVFTRFVKLPPVAEQQVEEIISFEAQQIVPFPINEVVWDYQLVGSGDNGDLEVILVAVKGDLLNEINDSVEEAGFVTNIVDVAPMALYNAFRYNYSDDTDCSLLIDLGSRTTSLIFIEPGRVFVRSIPIGGSTISEAISKDFDESFRAAEQRKIQDAFVSLVVDASDSDMARISKIVRNTMLRLQAEISRSISFYRVQQGGQHPAKIYLSGGAARLPCIREFFKERLGKPIQIFNPLRNILISDSLNVEEIGRRANVLGELVGLALRGSNDCPIELNLLPARVVAARKIRQRQPYFVLTGVCLLLTLAGWWLYFLRAASIENYVLSAEVDPKAKRLQSFEGEQKNVRRDVEDLEKRAQPLMEAVRQRGFWLRVLDDINGRLPIDNVWITSLEIGALTPEGEFTPLLGDFNASTSSGRPSPSRSGRNLKFERKESLGLRLKGLYLDNERQAGVVDEFLNKLNESPLLDIDMSRKNIVNPVRQSPTFTEWAYDFELRLKLKKAPFELLQ